MNMYSGDPNARLVRYLNGGKLSSIRVGRYVNTIQIAYTLQMVVWMPDWYLNSYLN